MSKLNGKVVEAVRIRDTEFGRVVGKSLKALREVSGLTQAEMAHRLQVGQAAISKIEHRGDIHISTLQSYVEALGATLRIDAAFSATAAKALKLESPFDHEASPDDQLIFPIFGDEFFKARKDVVLSIRPKYSDKIIQGEKTVELRRRFPLLAPHGTIAYIYSTSPVQAMVGSAEIEDVVKLPVNDIWRLYGKKAKITREDFDNYFSGTESGFALKFTNVKSFSRPIDLAELRERFSFEPPQSFLYATQALRMALQDEYSVVSN